MNAVRRPLPTAAPPAREIDYPESDGQPMAETDTHRWNMTDTIGTLAHHLPAGPALYVGGNLMMYYVEGDPRKCVSPDVFVVHGRPLLPPRRTWKTWVEGKGPDVVIEMTSPKTAREDQATKFALYRDLLRVREYFLFDPLDEYLTPRLQGFRLRAGKYAAIRPAAGRLPSRLLGLHLEADGDRLRLWDPAAGRRLPTPQERADEAEAAARAAEAAARAAEAAAREAEEGVRREAEARAAAEAEVERLRREIAKLRRRK